MSSRGMQSNSTEPGSGDGDADVASVKQGVLEGAPMQMVVYTSWKGVKDVQRGVDRRCGGR